MRTFRLFYSWQSDHPSDLCRNFIAEALKIAAEKIRASREIIVVIDADTQGVSGTPPISETILKKIDACDAFLADLTLVATTPAGKASPNPNVLIEYGYALKAKGSGLLILAMNTAFGGPEALPFDLRHLRHPLQYDADEAVTPAERRKRRASFAEKLVLALNAVIDQAPARQKPASKGPDPAALAAKRLSEVKANRGRGLPPGVQVPRVALDVIPFAATAEQRLDLRAVKAARPWFAPHDDTPCETTTQHGQWISRGLPQPDGWSQTPRWSTRLIAPGHLERIFSISRPGPRRVDITMDGWECDRQLLSAIRRSGELLSAIGLGGPAVVSLTVDNAEDLRLLTSQGEGTALGMSFAIFTAIEIADPRDPFPDEVRPMLDDLWQACGWEDGTPSINSDGWVEELMERDGERFEETA